MEYAIPFYIGTIHFCCEKNNETTKKKKRRGGRKEYLFRHAAGVQNPVHVFIPILTYTPPNVSL